MKEVAQVQSERKIPFWLPEFLSNLAGQKVHKEEKVPSLSSPKADVEVKHYCDSHSQTKR